jgi:uncharacterized protein (TIGR02453 family)
MARMPKAPKSSAPARFEGFADADGRFFKQLAKNNRRDWFLAHRGEYDDGWLTPMKLLLGEVKGAIDASYAHCDLDEPTVFRIFRDVRFSKDKSPYKTHIGGLVSVKRGGKATEVPAALYVQLGTEPFAAAGHYMMAPPELARFRAAVVDARRGAELGRIVASLAKKGFVVGSHDMLKKVPRGFDPEHPRAELLKRKGLIVSFPSIPKKLVPSRALVPWLAKQSALAAPLVEWITFATA